jgi:hypothetical protein
MTRDFEQVPRVKAAAIGKVGEGLGFSLPEVLAVIHVCSGNDIAVLGVELFLVKSDGYQASGCSDYDLQERPRWPIVQPADWPEFVRYDNALAEECVRRNPYGDDHVYLLTAVSWMEFSQIHRMKRE